MNICQGLAASIKSIKLTLISSHMMFDSELSEREKAIFILNIIYSKTSNHQCFLVLAYNLWATIREWLRIVVLSTDASRWGGWLTWGTTEEENWIKFKSGETVKIDLLDFFPASSASANLSLALVRCKVLLVFLEELAEMLAFFGILASTALGQQHHAQNKQTQNHFHFDGLRSKTFRFRMMSWAICQRYLYRRMTHNYPFRSLPSVIIPVIKLVLVYHVVERYARVFSISAKLSRSPSRGQTRS